MTTVNSLPAVLGKVQFLKLSREAEAVEQAEDQNRELRVGLKAKDSLEPAHVIEGFMDYGE